MGSSRLTQVYSWMWYSCDYFDMKPEVNLWLSLLPAIEIPVFGGDRLHFRSFLKASEQGIETKTDNIQDRLYYLEQFTTRQPRILHQLFHSPFASVLPCFIFSHFICSWLVLFFFAWPSKMNFMETAVGLIGYLGWFNVAEGKTRCRTALYHGYILTDICILCAVWCWKMSTDPPDFVIEPMHALITAACVVAVYIHSLILKVIYYKVFHPNPDKDELKGASTEQQPEDDVGLCMFAVAAKMADHCLSAPSAHCNKRMRKLAENFYS
ncbi:MFS transporter (organic cation transporter) [Sarotherodon galilaeus]